MNAIELAKLLEEGAKCGGRYTPTDMVNSANMLRQQAKEIELLKADVAGWMDTAIGKTPDENYWLNFAKKASEK